MCHILDTNCRISSPNSRVSTLTAPKSSRFPFLQKRQAWQPSTVLRIWMRTRWEGSSKQWLEIKRENLKEMRQRQLQHKSALNRTRIPSIWICQVRKQLRSEWTLPRSPATIQPNLTVKEIRMCSFLASLAGLAHWEPPRKITKHILYRSQTNWNRIDKHTQPRPPPNKIQPRDRIQIRHHQETKTVLWPLIWGLNSR